MKEIVNFSLLRPIFGFWRRGNFTTLRSMRMGVKYFRPSIPPPPDLHSPTLLSPFLFILLPLYADVIAKAFAEGHVPSPVVFLHSPLGSLHIARGKNQRPCIAMP